MKQKIKLFWLKIWSKVLLLLGNMGKRIKNYKFRWPRKRFWYRFFFGVAVLAVVGYAAILAVFLWYSKDLPTPTKVVRQTGFSSQIYDRNGQLLYELYKDANLLPVAWADVPSNLKNATVAVEDKDFYKHGGF